MRNCLEHLVATGRPGREVLDYGVGLTRTTKACRQRGSSRSVGSVDCVGGSPSPAETETPAPAVRTPCRCHNSSLYAQVGHMKASALGPVGMTVPSSRPHTASPPQRALPRPLRALLLSPPFWLDRKIRQFGVAMNARISPFVYDATAIRIMRNASPLRA